ncbi:MAG TPA: bifunctional metallophosphatase/5'-nucleotidase, partial [Solirubrobacteraceae bacterium]|nr:bifunctional metallophosphatase/5'-nucleotidase [Solirubrobacteraceae bacterium]
MRRTHRLLGGLAVAALLALPAASADAKPKPNDHVKDVQVQLLGLNDFHGQLEALDPAITSSGRITPAPGVADVPAGGAAYLAEHIRQLEATVKKHNSLVVSAGDLIGASPLLSALFHDEPTIEAMNQIGLDLNAVGNHEFDEGTTELRRMAEGGCIEDKPAESCVLHEFEGADFRFLAANVVDAETGEPLFAPYAIRKFQGIKVGFIGMTLEGTPDIVSAAGIAGFEFLDEADTANRYAEELRTEHGVEAIVVLLHEGGFPTPFAGINSCNVSGPIVDIVTRTSDEVDLFVTGHTHQPYVCNIDGRPVTSASSLGRLVTDIDLTLDRRTRDVEQVTANNVIITRDVEADAGINTLIADYQVVAAPLAARPIGEITGTTGITRTTDASGESTAGNLIADAQLAASPGSVAAFMNPGGIRADINAGTVTYGESFAMQPFGNNLVQMDLTGAQIRLLLKQQWCGQSSQRILAVSGVTYTWDQSVAQSITGLAVNCATAADPVSNLLIGGQPVVDSQVYRITVNSFLADGGDRFFVLREGT